MRPSPVPAAVYAAAKRLDDGISRDRDTDVRIVRAWIVTVWPDPPDDPETQAFWTLEVAVTDGHEPEGKT